MPIAINGSGTITGVSAGGLNDGSINTEDLNAGTASVGQKLVASGASGAMSWGSSVVSAAVQASTSGTSITFGSIPSWARRVTMSLNGVSLSGTALIRFRLGTASGVATSGYNGAGSVISSAVVTANQTAGFDMYTNTPNAAYLASGQIVFTLIDAGNNIWAASGLFASHSVAWTQTIAGVVALSGTLTQVVATTSNGTDTFDAGSINVFWE